MPIDEYTLQQQIITAIPQTICHWLINYKDLSTSTSMVVEWVDTIERREHELLEKGAYNATVAATKKTNLGLASTQPTYPATSVRMFKKPVACVTNTVCTGNPSEMKPQVAAGTSPNATMAPQTLDRSMPMGQPVLSTKFHSLK
jgi:hypothetical protein